jgi:hypothetical protein
VSTSNPRRRLANRRSAETLGLECAGLAYTRTVTYFADGRLAEVFLGNRKNNSGTDVVGRDSAVVLSIPLQHGADPDILRWHRLTGRRIGAANLRLSRVRACDRSQRKENPWE